MEGFKEKLLGIFPLRKSKKKEFGQQTPLLEGKDGIEDEYRRTLRSTILMHKMYIEVLRHASLFLSRIDPHSAAKELGREEDADIIREEKEKLEVLLEGLKRGESLFVEVLEEEIKHQGIIEALRSLKNKFNSERDIDELVRDIDPPPVRELIKKVLEEEVKGANFIQPLLKIYDEMGVVEIYFDEDEIKKIEKTYKMGKIAEGLLGGLGIVKPSAVVELKVLMALHIKELVKRYSSLSVDEQLEIISQNLLFSYLRRRLLNEYGVSTPQMEEIVNKLDQRLRERVIKIRNQLNKS